MNSQSPPRLEIERAELEVMVERLARSSRLSNLLRYLGEKYLRGEAYQISEYGIATDVFGRAAAFDPSQDAIARVETHRLRKKLKEFYETEGKDFPIRILIPAGSYVPLFQHRSELERPYAAPATLAEPISHPSVLPVQKEVEEDYASLLAPPPPPSSSRLWLYAACGAIAIIILTLIGMYRTQPASAGSSQRPATGAIPAALVAVPSPVGVPGSAIRFLAGHIGQPHIDPSGVVWGPDQFFERGGGWHGAQQFTGRTNDQFLFQSIRTGEFAYNIPLKPGTYELHLYFDEFLYGPGLGGGELSRAFNVQVNGENLLPGFDIVADANGPNLADERVFKDIHPASDGKLHLEFEGQSGKPLLNALAILPGIPHKQIPIRITAQPTDFIDHAGRVWAPDNYYLGGQHSVKRVVVTGTEDPGLFSIERFGHFSYAIPADTRSRYTVNLYFAESYFGPEGEGKGGTGSRKFNVTCNGVMLLEEFDIFKEVGTLRPLMKTFRHLKPSAQGKLTLGFEPIANYANVSALEVIDESQ